MELSSSKIKKFPIIPEMELSSLIFSLYFRKEISELQKLKNRSEKLLTFSQKKLFL